MAREGMGGTPDGPQGGSVEAGLPWRSRALAHFYERRDPHDYLRVRLDAAATHRVWEEYRRYKAKGQTQLLLFRPEGSFVEAVGYHRAVERAMLERGIVYNVKSRNCWRPVWWPSTPVDIRGLGNVHYEPVIILGYDSFIEGWANRPRAKLFDNS